MLGLRMHVLVGCALAFLVPACVIAPTDSSIAPRKDGAESWSGYVPDLPVSEAPFDDVEASWKQRIDQPYVYISHLGSYTETGALIPVLQREMIAQELEPTGPPFALYYDDPGTTPVERLRSRACIPIGGERSPRQPLQYEVLPSTTVVYALVAGPYPEVPRSYPGLYAFLEHQGWIENGPIREIYLVPPTSVENWNELLTEVQLPATAAQ
jgi:effector-binding domain-containing protein